MEILYAHEQLDRDEPEPGAQTPIMPVVVNVRRCEKTFWMFTLFLDEETDDEDIREHAPDWWHELPEGVRFIAWQLEECPETKRLHLQCYIELLRTRPLQWLKDHISPTAHFQWRRGTQAQAIAYVSKLETRIAGPFELGTKSVGRGGRTDLIALRESVKLLMSTREINENQCVTLARYVRYFNLTKNLYRPRYDPELPFTVTLNIGEAGCGKTRYVYDKWGNNSDFYEVAITNNNLWFDGYDKHKYVLFDDFSGSASHIRLDTALKLFDRYPRMVPIKGGYEWWVPREIQVTTNIHPRLWYSWDNREEQYAALKRRFNGGTYTWEDGERVLVDGDFWDRGVIECIWIQPRNNN